MSLSQIHACMHTHTCVSVHMYTHACTSTYTIIALLSSKMLSFFRQQFFTSSYHFHQHYLAQAPITSYLDYSDSLLVVFPFLCFPTLNSFKTCQISSRSIPILPKASHLIKAQQVLHNLGSPSLFDSFTIPVSLTYFMPEALVLLPFLSCKIVCLLLTHCSSRLL